MSVCVCVCEQLLTSSAYVTGGVWCPGNAVDRSSVVAQSGNWYAGHSHIQNNYLKEQQ